MRPHRRLLLAVLALPIMVLAPLPGASASGDFRQVVDITFPTDPGATYGDDYEHARGGGRLHLATDLMGERGRPVYAAVGGTVTWMPSGLHATAGYALYVRGDDGRTYGYMHLDGYADGITAGSGVARGQVIGTLGATGNAGTPHLHFEIHDDAVTDPQGGNRINPYYSLLDAERRGDYAGGAELVAAGTVDRVAGPERVATAATMAARAFPEGADRVVLAAATAYADAIVAGPLAAALGGPVLTTYGAGLHERTRQALEELAPREVVLVDGTGSLSPKVAEDLVGLGVATITEIRASSPAALAAEVADRVWALTGSGGALVALGSHPEPARAWPDALTAGYYGAVLGQPVLLTDPDALPAETAAALGRATSATIVGGTQAITPWLADEVAALVREVRRLAGSNRYGTAAAVAGDLLDRGAVETDRLWAATGNDYADALAAAAVVARLGDLLVLVEGEVGEGDAPLDDWLTGRETAFERGRVIGGAAAVSEGARVRLAERIAAR
jgi:putative cell wall-binding protein